MRTSFASEYIIYILILPKRQQLNVIQAWDSTKVAQEFLNATKSARGGEASKNSYVSIWTVAKDGLLNFDARIYILDGTLHLPPYWRTMSPEQ